MVLVLPNSMSFKAWVKREAAPLHGFEEDISSESVGDQHVHPLADGLPPFNVADEVDAPRLVGLG